MISAGRIDLSAKGTLTLDTSANNTNIVLTPGTGNVGIGTTAPDTRLHVKQSSGNTFITVDSVAAAQSGINFYKDGAYKWIQYVDASSNDLRFYDGGNRVVFQSGGNVGIGSDTTPDYLLDVQGTFNSDGATYLATTTGNVGISSTSPAGILDIGSSAAGILLRAGQPGITISSSSAGHTADIQIAAPDRIDMFASSFNLTTSNTSDGSLKLTSYGNLTLDTSQGNKNILLRAGAGSINLSSGTTTISGNVNLNSGTLALNGVAYTFPGADGSASNVLTTSGTGLLSWGTLGAGSITADALDFSEFKDELTLDADTTINGDYSLVLRSGLGSIQNSTSGSNDLQLSAEDKLILEAASFDLLTSSGGIDMISAGRIDLSAKGNLTLDTSQNNTDIRLLAGTGNLTFSGAGATITAGSTSTALGDGTDGAITVTSSKNLNTTNVQTGRTCTD
ncbi:MAG: hypothetical protein AABZ07_02915, partial [Nitrospirota bacterium]